MKKNIPALLLCVFAVSAQFAKASEPFHEVKLPPNATKLCREHVVGAPSGDGRPGPHIDWQAHSSPDAPETVAQYYAEQFGRKAGVAHDGSPEWRFGPEHSLWIYSVYTAQAESLPSRICQVPAHAKSVILIS